MPSSSMLCDVISAIQQRPEEGSKRNESSLSLSKFENLIKPLKLEKVCKCIEYELWASAHFSLHTSFLASASTQQKHLKPEAYRSSAPSHAVLYLRGTEEGTLARVGLGIVSLDMILIPSPDPYRQKRCFRHQFYPSIWMSGHSGRVEPIGQQFYFFGLYSSA